MSTASRGRALEWELRDMFKDKGWDVVRGAGSKGGFSEMKPDLTCTRKTSTQLRRAGIKTGWYLQINEDGNLEVFDVAAVQAKLEKEKA